jgi:hypothetical protein
MGKRWLRVAGLTMVVLLVPIGTGHLPPAHACSCLPVVPAYEGHLARADVVFDAVATQRTGGAGSFDPVTYRFDVAGVVKGTTTDPQDVLTAANGALCGIEFEIGLAYRVFARRQHDGTLSTGMCDGSRLLTGYRMAAADGGVFAFGSATFHGSAAGLPLNAPVVGIAATPTGRGYWLAAADGGVFAYGDASFHGSAGGRPLNAPVVGIAPTPTGRGYWLAAADGGIFAYGDARFLGSAAGLPLVLPVVGVAATGRGAGYWLLGGDGGVFGYGDAPFLGRPVVAPTPTPGFPGPAAPSVAGITATHAGTGYWIADRSGRVSGFGDTAPLGPSHEVVLPGTVGVARTSTAPGLVIADAAGRLGIFNVPAFGDLGPYQPLNAPIVAVSS